MNKRGRFSLRAVVTVVLLASLMLTAASVMALPNLPDPGNPGPLLPPPVLATATPTPVPEEEDEDQDEHDDEDGDEDEDEDPGSLRRLPLQRHAQRRHRHKARLLPLQLHVKIGGGRAPSGQPLQATMVEASLLSQHLQER